MRERRLGLMPAALDRIYRIFQNFDSSYAKGYGATCGLIAGRMPTLPCSLQAEPVLLGWYAEIGEG